MIDFHQIPYSQINNIKCGQDWVTEEGEIIPNSQLVTPAEPPRSYAYCSDTKYMPAVAQFVKDVNLLYHESTYTDEKTENAAKYHHCTGSQAANIAKMAHVKKLLLGHFSASTNEQTLLQQAQAIFESTQLAKEGMVVDVI
jgi:ribonuclease Z